MWITDIIDRLFPIPPLGPHPDDLRREREAKCKKTWAERRRAEIEAQARFWNQDVLVKARARNESKAIEEMAQKDAQSQEQVKEGVKLIVRDGDHIMIPRSS